MGKEPPPDIESNPQPRRGDGVVAHPVAVEPAIRRTPPPSGELLPFRHWSPWLVPLFFAANVAVFVVAMYVNDCPKNSASCIFRSLGRFAFQPLRENPLLGPSTSTLDKMGALVVTEIVNGHQGWRLITCIWLHAGVFHLVANMFSLLFIGIRLEQEFGFVRIGMLYVISGFGGSLTSALFIQSSTSVGASGALFGLLGGMLSELITNWTIYSNKLAALLTLVFTIAINLAVGILPHVDNFAHIGGFTSGFLLGFVFLIRPQFRWVNQKNAPLGYHAGRVNKHKLYQCVLWVIATLFLIVGFAVSLILLFRGFNVTNHCSWCHYLTCIPSSAWNCTPTRFYCTASRAGRQLNLTCDGRMQSYLFADVTDPQVRGLCAQLCS